MMVSRLVSLVPTDRPYRLLGLTSVAAGFVFYT